MPFGDYKDMDDCIAKNQDKDNPGAYCASIHHQITGEWPSAKEAAIHPDFLKIYKQFIAHIDDEQEAHNRYCDWVRALNLDDTKPYGQSMREQFRWIRKHVDFDLWKEDKRAKYWQVEAGFPVESMNVNIYTEQELLESGRTLAHKPVVLNHKFTLPTIDIPASKYEDGVVECVLRVPKELRCPICSEKKTVNDLIESGDIVNVSLEAVCTLRSDDPHKCEGMEFTGLSLLTKDTLPGIPLTRLMPLEHIMVEALQSSTRRTKVKKVKMKIVEQAQPRTDAERAKALFNISDEEWNKLSDEQKQAYIDKLPERGSAEQITTVQPVDADKPGARDIAPATVKPDEHGRCPEGMILNTELDLCVKDTSCPEGQHFDEPSQQCVSDTPPKPEVPITQAGTSVTGETVTTDDQTDILSPEIPTPSPEKPTGGETPPGDIPKDIAQPAGKPATLPKPETPGELEPEPAHKCPDGYHYEPTSTPPCVPNEPLTERIQRFKVEDANKSLRVQVVEWQRRYATLDTKHNKTLGIVTQQQSTISKLETQKDNAVRDFRNQQVAAEKWKRLRDEAVGLRDDYKTQLEDVQKKHEALNRKYHTTLDTNLALSQKLTKSNEDYLAVAKQRDEARDALKRAKVMAKKTIRIKAV